MEEMQKEEGVSLLEIIRILFHKLKLLILVVIIGAVCGAAFGVWRTKDVKYYGTSIEFYVNPEKPKEVGSSSSSAANAVGSQYGVYGAYGRHVMDAIVKLLESESFAEQLMLEENGLPDLKIYNDHTYNETNYSNAEAAIKAANDAWDKAEELDLPRSVALENLENAWTSAGQSGSFSLANYNRLVLADQAPDYLVEAYNAYKDADTQRNEFIQNAEREQVKRDAAVEIVLEEWRMTGKYKSNLTLYKNAVAFSYLGADEDVEDANNLARSFIYVDINVLNNEVFAKDVLARVKRAVPEYIEKNMIVPTDYEGTSCTRITRTDDIRRLNPNYTRNQAIKYAVLLAAAAGVIAAIIVIVIDVQDKRLRDYELVAKKLNVPVLGVVPTIEEMNAAVENKKLEEKKRNKEVK